MSLGLQINDPKQLDQDFDLYNDPTILNNFSSCSSSSVSPSSSSLLNNYTNSYNTRTSSDNTIFEDEDIIDSCLRIRSSLNNLCKKYYAPASKSIYNSNSSTTTFVPKSNYTEKNLPILPMILLLGNHSSGKSSFVNYILGQKIQKTGVAPTDDCFTLILSGEKDENYNGYNLVNDKNFGFEDLKQFGMNLINHTKLKIRKDLLLNDVILVDSPGMIDIPGYDNNIDELDTIESRRKNFKEESSFSNSRKRGRGYNFTEVCRWYAERADIILLFFDPEKPGTTGETLNTLSNSLNNMEHKLFIILNKADKFNEIVDFAKTIGTLSWNLSKVIKKKEFPRIYTMYIPNEKMKLKSLKRRNKMKKMGLIKSTNQEKNVFNEETSHQTQNFDYDMNQTQNLENKSNLTLSDEDFNLIQSNDLSHSFDLTESFNSSPTEPILGDDSDIFLKKSAYGSMIQQGESLENDINNNEQESVKIKKKTKHNESLVKKKNEVGSEESEGSDYSDSELSEATREKGFLDYIIDDLECTR